MNQMGAWFVSHCTKDIKVVDQIVEVLKNCGIPYWKAPEMIPPGSNYAKEIPMALKNCDVFLFVVSEAAQSSIWVEKEVDRAVNARKKIIPIRIDDKPLSDMYTFYMNNIQMIDIKIEADGTISKEGLEKLYVKFRESIPQKFQPKEISSIEIPQKESVSSEPIQETVKIHSPISFLENPDAENEMERSKVDARTNALRINRIPMQCEKCGVKLEHVDVGTYQCPACHTTYYDDFQKIKNFIEENGPAPAFIISRSTGVAKQTVEYYFKDDYRRPSVENRRIGSSDGLWHSNLWKK